MPRPLLALSCAFAGGCLVGGAEGPSAGVLLGLSAGLLLLALASRVRRAAAGALLAAAFGLGAAGAEVERESHRTAPLHAFAEAREPDAPPVSLEGVARGDLQAYAGRTLLVLDVERIEEAGRIRRATGRIRVDVGGRTPPPPILSGDRVRLWAAVRPVRGIRNPGGRDAAAGALQDGVHAAGSCKTARLVEVVARGGGLEGAAARARAAARRELARHVPPGPEEGLVRAMVLGDRTGVDEDTAEAFRAAGTYHVLALSGAQVALLAGLLVWALRWIGVGPLPRAAITIAAVSFYAVLVGGDVPIVRAAVMAAALLAGQALELEGDATNLLGLAGLLLLGYRPSSVGDVGLQLSFVATLAILLVTPRLLDGVRRLPLRLELTLAASVAAQAALLPFLAGHFHRAAPAALVLNLLALPLASAVLLAGLAVLGAALVLPPLAPVVGHAAFGAAWALRHSSDLAQLVPGLDWRTPALSFLAVAAWAAGIARLVQGRRTAGLALVAAAHVLYLLEPPAPGDGRLQLTVLDVGQGDALVARSPGGAVLVVDAGGSARGRYDPGEQVVAPFLWASRLRRVEALVVTHAHPDHSGGVPFLLRTFGVASVWEGKAPRGDRSYRALAEALSRSGAPTRAVARGMRTWWDGVEVRVLGPVPGPPPWRVRNDDSVVLTLRLGGVRFLLTGDVETTAETGALGDAREVASAVVKVPHHGSRSSSSPGFVAAVAPSVAVISAGARNPFGHPHPEVLERYRRAGALVLRTDRDGAITVSTDGRRVWVRSMALGRERRVR